MATLEQLRFYDGILPHLLDEKMVSHAFEVHQKAEAIRKEMQQKMFYMEDDDTKPSSLLDMLEHHKENK